MAQRIQILKSKLLTPYSPDTIKRERLYSLLSKIPEKRLTTVIAGAGFGKTTLVSEASDYFGFNTVWYRLDKSDRDFITFISYLIAGIQKYFPKFGEETFHRIVKAQKLSRESELLLTIFLSEIEKVISEDLIIIFDDYHFIQDSIEINDSLEFIIENLPPQLHLVIISRVDPGLHLSRFKARREVLDVKEEDIVFTISEVERLYSQLFNLSLQHESLQSLHQKTDGWITGLILFYHSIKGKSHEEVEELLLKLKGSHRNISNYLEENVFDLQAVMIKEFLVKTSILSRLNASFCNQFLSIRNSREILIDLEENHLFIVPLSEERDRSKGKLKQKKASRDFAFIDEDEEWYSYQQLFQDFLQTKLQHELDREAVLKLHNEAAILWEKQGESEEALKHYLKAEQFEKLCSLLGKWGLNKLIYEGRLQVISSYLQKIPESYFNKEPWLQYMQAHMLELSGKLKEAIHIYNKALKTFRRQKSIMGEVMCLKSLVFSTLIYGDHKSAVNILKALSDPLKDIPQQLSVDIMGLLTFLSIHLGKIADADKYFKQGLALSTELNDKNVHAMFHIYKILGYVFSGDYNEAYKIGEQIEEECDEEGDYYYHLHTMNYLLLSFSCHSSGLYSKGVDYARKGLDLVIERELLDVSQAWLLIVLGFNVTALGRITEAIDYGKESLKIFKDAGCCWGQAEAYYLLSFIYIRLEDLSAAEQCIRSGLEVIKGLTLPMEEGMLKASLAQLLIRNRNLSKAKPLLEDAERLLKKSKAGRTQVYLRYTRLYCELKQKDEALEKLIPALRLSEANKYDSWIINEKYWIMPLLIEVFARDKMKDYIKNLFKKIGLSAIEELTRLQKSKNSKTKKAASVLLDEIGKAPSQANDLRIYCFGKFRVFRGDDEIPLEKWKSKKARMLFKYLVHSRNRGYLSRDILMELLWPEEDPVKSINRLHDALYSLRKIIEPDSKSAGAALFLLREGDNYMLSLGNEGWVDVDEFRKELELAKKEKDLEKSISHYMRADAVYSGDFLEEDVYVEWCAEERAILKEEYLNLLIKIMGYFEKRNDYAKCIEYAGKYLKAERCNENVYRQLMQYYHFIGNKSMLVRTFERCKKNLEESEIPLSKEMESLYHKLSSRNSKR